MEQINHTAAAAATVDHDGHAGLLDDLMARVAPAAAARQRARDGDATALGLIPVTIPELLRQLRGTVIPWPGRDKAHRDAWTLWRRRHQHCARQAHQRWNAYADELPQPI